MSMHVIYTVPDGATYTTSGTYMDTIPNVNGCDSVITINLTVEYTELNEINKSNLSAFPNSRYLSFASFEFW